MADLTVNPLIVSLLTTGILPVMRPHLPKHSNRCLEFLTDLAKGKVGELDGDIATGLMAVSVLKAPEGLETLHKLGRLKGALIFAIEGKARPVPILIAEQEVRRQHQMRLNALTALGANWRQRIELRQSATLTGGKCAVNAKICSSPNLVGSFSLLVHEGRFATVCTSCTEGMKVSKDKGVLTVEPATKPVHLFAELIKLGQMPFRKEGVCQVHSTFGACEHVSGQFKLSDLVLAKTKDMEVQVCKACLSKFSEVFPRLKVKELDENQQSTKKLKSPSSLTRPPARNDAQVSSIDLVRQIVKGRHVIFGQPHPFNPEGRFATCTTVANGGNCAGDKVLMTEMSVIELVKTVPETGELSRKLWAFCPKCVEQIDCSDLGQHLLSLEGTRVNFDQALPSKRTATEPRSSATPDAMKVIKTSIAKRLLTEEERRVRREAAARQAANRKDRAAQQSENAKSHNKNGGGGKKGKSKQGN